MKKEYIKPMMRVVALKHQTHILAGSGYDNVSAPVDTYDPNDVIDTKGGVW